MKKIAMSTVKAFLKENDSPATITKEFSVGESAFMVELRTALSVAEKSTFVGRVLSGCFDRAGNFRPEYVAPMFRATILQVCTNIPTLTLKNESADDGGAAMDLDAMNDLYLALKLYDVEDQKYRAMEADMAYLCDEAIEWRRQKSASESGVGKSIENFIETVTEKVGSVDMEDLMQYAAALSEQTKDLDGESILSALVKEAHPAT